MQNSTTTNKNKILVSSTVPRSDNLNGKDHQVNNILENLYLENNLACVNHDKIKPQQPCNYGGIHLNIVVSKISADNLILALTKQT